MQFPSAIRYNFEQLNEILQSRHKINFRKHKKKKVENEMNKLEQGFEKKYGFSVENKPYLINTFEDISWYDPFPDTSSFVTSSNEEEA